jgi:hypothetical protein
MSIGNLKDYNNKGNNLPWQLAVLELLGLISVNSNTSGLAQETTLQQVLATLQSGVDFEAKLVVDNNNVTWLEVRIWNQGTSSFNPPVYYSAGSNVPGSPALPITYINPQTLLAQIVANTIGLATETTLSAINIKLTGASRTANYIVATTNGSTPAGVQSISLSFRGANGTLNGAAVPNGFTISFSPNKGEDTIGSINYTVPTTGAMQILIAYTI